MTFHNWEVLVRVWNLDILRRLAAQLSYGYSMEISLTCSLRTSILTRTHTVYTHKYEVIEPVLRSVFCHFLRLLSKTC